MTGPQAGNQLVVMPKYELSTDGAGIIESAVGIVTSINEGEWASFAGNTIATGLAALGAITDPIGALASAFVGWAIEYFDFLREPLNWLAGDTKAIEANRDTWRNISGCLEKAAQAYERYLSTNTALWQSQAAAAYQAGAHVRIEALMGLAIMAGGGEKACVTTGAVIGLVRATIRDIIADVVGAVISKGIQALTVVLAPKVLAEVALLVSEVSTKILNLLDRLLRTVRKLSGSLELGTKWLKSIEDALQEVKVLRNGRVAGDLLGGFGNTWRATSIAERLAGGSAINRLKSSAASGLMENLAQEAGKAGDALRTQARRAEDQLRQQQSQAQQAAA